MNILDNNASVKILKIVCNKKEFRALMKIINMIFILSMFTSAMEIQQNVCYLAYLPKEVQDMIAVYLPFKAPETDEELKKRAFEIYKLPEPSSLITEHFSAGLRLGFAMGPIIAAYLIDRSKILFIERYHLDSLFLKVAIIDLKKNQKISQENLNEIVKVNMFSLIYMTLSYDEKLVAILLAKKSPAEYRGGFAEIHKAHYILVIKNRDTLKEIQFNLPTYSTFNKCEFNKQGTKIFAFGRNTRKEIEYQKIYEISNINENLIKNQKTLSEFFRQNGICKDLKKSLSQ